MDTGIKTGGFTGVKRLPGVFMSNALKCLYRHNKNLTNYILFSFNGKNLH